MKAIEFQAVISNGIIQIPEKYADMMDKFARVIILADEEEAEVEEKEEEKASAKESVMDQIRAWKVFGQIADPIEWQRRLGRWRSLGK